MGNAAGFANLSCQPGPHRKRHQDTGFGFLHLPHDFFRLDDHVARFLRSAAGMRLKCPHEPAQLKQILATCVQRAGLESSYVQMIMTRGTYQSLANRDPRLCENRFIAYALPYIWIISPEKQAAAVNEVIQANMAAMAAAH